MAKSKEQKDKTPRYIEITFCTAQGSQFENLKRGTQHKVVTPPQGYTNDDRGVWVMGVGEPVKVLNKEYKVIDAITKI